jgi:glycosyltransferase involved in cell wall biosynthesis
MGRMAFNLAFVDAGPLTGPGYYAVQLFEHFVVLNAALDKQHSVTGYVQSGAMGHFSSVALEHLRVVPNLRGRVSRVLFEHTTLPFLTWRAKTDLLFSPAFVSPVWGGRHLVVTICDMYYRVVPELVEPFQLKYWRLMIPLTTWSCTKILTISENSKTDIEHFLPSSRGKTISIPLASRFPILPICQTNKGEQSGDPFLLMVANLTPNKNCEAVVKAVATLRAAGRNISFVHAGKDHLGLLARSVEAFGAEAFVKSVGKVSDEELVGLYQRSLAVVVPSLYEGFGMPAVEAQAMGVPLICSDRAALPEAAGDGALFFDPEDSEALTSQIAAVLNMDWVARRALVEKGHRNVSQFSWERTARETLTVFEDVLNDQ